MLPISMSSSTTTRRAFPISSLQLHARRVQLASLLRIAAHGLNMLLCDFSLERTEPAQAKPMFSRHGADLFHAPAGKMLTQCIVIETPFQGQGNCLCHAGISFAWRKTEIKVEINGSWHIDHSTVNY